MIQGATNFRETHKPGGERGRGGFALSFCNFFPVSRHSSAQSVNVSYHAWGPGKNQRHRGNVVRFAAAYIKPSSLLGPVSPPVLIDLEREAGEFILALTWARQMAKLPRLDARGCSRTPPHFRTCSTAQGARFFSPGRGFAFARRQPQERHGGCATTGYGP